MPPTTTEQRAFSVTGMDCASCVAHVDHAARAVPGVSQVNVNLARGRAVVEFDPQRARPEEISKAITESGYPTAVEEENSGAAAESQRLEKQAQHTQEWLRRALVAGALWLPVELGHWLAMLAGRHDLVHGAGFIWLTLATATAAIVFTGGAFYRSAWGALRRGTSNMDTLIAMGVTVAYAYSLIALGGYELKAWAALPNLYFMEATGLLALISSGHYLEARARRSAGSAIHQLLNLTPAAALRVEDPNSAPAEVPVAELQVGDRILVRPGDRVPSDSVVIEGTSAVDESMLTGESLPVRRSTGDTIIGGTINHDGRLIARVSRVGKETALAQIIQLVESAQNSKPPVQKLADRIAAIFVPTVLGIAIVTAIAWYAAGSMNHWSAATTWSHLANAVCSVLIIACPCALGLAIPAALMVATGFGARHGILIRDIDALQAAEKIGTVVLDKTGTITAGKPVVTALHATDNVREDELLALAASAEQFSEHPLGKAIVARAREKGSRIRSLSAFNNEPGRGVTATIDGESYFVGKAEGETTSPEMPGATNVQVRRIGSNGAAQSLGSITLADTIKPDSLAAIEALHQMGLSTVLLTGDNERSAAAIAQSVGIKNIRANVKPQGKAEVVARLKEQVKFDEMDTRQAVGVPGPYHVAMVGDGINDAPALAAADLGIAMGTGSDIAKETGGIVLVSGSLAGVPAAIKLSRATMTVIRQNLFFAFIYNVLAIPIAAGVLYPLLGDHGLLNPLIAAAAMALSDVTVIGNALRLRRVKID
jgi:P-type Cu+ transporter